MSKFDRLVQSILEGQAPVGMDTYWEDEGVRVSIKDVIQYLDSINAPEKEVSIDKIKPVIINQDYKGAAKERVDKADLRYPLIVAVQGGRYKSILDGNHRAFKALRDNIPAIKVREVDLDSKDVPEIYKQLFGYSIEPLK
jgi:hydrogenase maturation factor HypE